MKNLLTILAFLNDSMLVDSYSVILPSVCCYSCFTGWGWLPAFNQESPSRFFIDQVKLK
jgi:hypothetical protein